MRHNLLTMKSDLKEPIILQAKCKTGRKIFLLMDFQKENYQSNFFRGKIFENKFRTYSISISVSLLAIAGHGVSCLPFFSSIIALLLLLLALLRIFQKYNCAFYKMKCV